MTTRSRTTLGFVALRSGWAALTGAGVVAAVVYHFAGDLLQAVIYDGVYFMAAAVIVGSSWRRDRVTRAGWRLVALALTLFGLGNVVWDVYELVLDRPTPQASWADVLFLCAYPALAAGMIAFVRAASPGKDRDGLIDGAIIGAGGALAAWQYLIQPRWAAFGTQGLVVGLVNVAYPVGDVLILAVTARLFVVRRQSRDGSRLLLVAAVLALLTADVAYAALSQIDAYHTGNPIDAGFILFPLLFAAALLHPDSERLTTPIGSFDTTFGPLRWAFLAVAILAGPAVLAIEGIRHAHVNAAVDALLSTVLAGLLLFRVRGLVHEVGRSNSRQRRVLEQATDGFFALDHGGRFSYLNPAAERLLGGKAEDLLGMRYCDVLPPEFEAAFVDRAVDALLGDTKPTTRVYDEAGKRWLEVHVHPGEDGITSYVRDVTMQHDADERLALQAGALDAAPAMILITDTDLRIVYANAAFVSHSGWTRSEIVGRPLSEVSSPDAREAIDNGLVSLHAGWPWRTLVTNTTKAGRPYPEEISATSLPTQVGEGQIVWIKQDVTERSQLEERLTHLAFHDPLTALPNRAGLRERLDADLAMASTTGRTVALLFLDLDRFKVVNDSLGHDAGDALLVEVAARLKACVRPGDTVGRLGGDEFTVILQELADPVFATEVAGRIGEALQQPVVVGGREVYVGASIGIALSTAGRVPSADLLRAADGAMYRAKRNGRSRYELAGDDQAENLQRLDREVELRRAIANGEITFHLQPEIDLMTGEVVGAEALARWNHPRLGMLGPGEFVGIAEESGLIVALDRAVLAQACAEAASWADDPVLGHMTVGVNMSAAALVSPNVVDEIGAMLDHTGLDPRRLRIELTETVAINDVQAGVGVLSGLRALGVQIAIDDFGTGYSSLAHLRRLPADVIKLDRTFLATLETDGPDVAIVAAIIDLGHALSLRVVAEGVEGMGQLQRLTAMGCDGAQGYMLGRPLPPAAARAAYGSEASQPRAWMATTAKSSSR